jgi:hypothetical protein
MKYIHSERFLYSGQTRIGRPESDSSLVDTIVFYLEAGKITSMDFPDFTRRLLASKNSPYVVRIQVSKFGLSSKPELIFLWRIV